MEKKGGGLGFLLVQAAQKWRNELTDELRDLDVTPPQLFVLMTVLRHAHHGGAPVTQRDVADKTRSDANTTSQVVRTLEARSLVVRAPHPTDSRAVALSLSHAGLELARECSLRVRTVNERFFRDAARPELAEQLALLVED